MSDVVRGTSIASSAGGASKSLPALAASPPSAASSDPEIVPIDVAIPVGGDSLRAWLFEPSSPGPHPVVVMGNGLALTRDAGLDRYGKRFASAGIAALAFDYRSFGDSDGQPRQNLTIAQQLADWRAAIGYARSHPHLRSDAVAAWGFSFGGGHAITLSCEPLGLAAVVAVCPFVDGLRLTLALPRKNAVRLGWAALRDRTARALHLDRVWVPATTAPGSFAILTHPGAYDGFQSIHPDWTRFDNRVTAGQAFTLFRYRPGRSLAKSLGPIQICAADDDLIIETTSIRRFAQGLSEVTFNSYPGGHFDLFTGQGFERALNDQLQFLRRHLRLGKERAL